MAQLTTEGRIDGRVTHQAVSHLRVVGRSSDIAFCKATMTRYAGILSLQLLPSRSCRRQISATVDGCSQSGSHIPERQVLLMVELQSSCRTLEDISSLALIVLHGMESVMAGHTGCSFGQVIISRKPA